MSVAQEEKDTDTADDQAQQQEAEGEEKQAVAANAEGAETETEAEEEAAKEQVTPSLTVTSPGSGAQFPGGEPILVEFDCEGDVEFTAHANVVDATGKVVVEDAADLKLEEGKGHGTFSLAGEQLVGGKYDVMVWGDSNGQATAVQKLQVEVVDTEAEEEPAPAVAVEGDDDDGKGAIV